MRGCAEVAQRGRARVLLLAGLLASAAALAAAVLDGPGALLEGRGGDVAETGGVAEPLRRVEPDRADVARGELRSAAPPRGPATARRDAEGAEAAGLRLRVVGAATGEPIAGASLSLLTNGTGTAPPPARTDALGWAGVPSLEPGVEALEVAAPGHVALALPAALVHDGETVELALAGQLVVHAPGVPDVEVVLLRGVDASLRVPEPPIAAPVQSPVDRSFRFEGLAPGVYSVAAMDARRWLGGEVGVEVVGGSVTTVAIDVEPSATFIGEVVEIGSGRPMAGVRVDLAPWAASVLTAVQRAAIPTRSTGPRGRFELEGVPLGRARVVLTLPDGTQVNRDVVVREGQAARVVTLRARGSARLSGRLAGDLTELAPAASWRVQVRPLYGLRDVVRAIGAAPDARADAGGAAGAASPVTPDGSFDVGTVPAARPLVVFATAPGVREVGLARITEPLEAGESRDGVVVARLRGRSVELVVMDIAGEPIRSIEVSFEERIDGRDATGAFRSFESPSGRYELRAGTGDVERIRVRADGFATRWAAVPRADEALEVRLSPARSVDLVLVDPVGRPVESTSILALTDARAGTGARTAGVARRVAVTDALGRATLDLDDRWAWIVGHSVDRASHSGAIAVVAPGDRPERPIVLECAPAEAPGLARIRGRIVRPGRRAPIHDLRFFGTRGASVEIEGERFEIVGVPHGPVQIVVRIGGYEPLLLPVDGVEAGDLIDVGELVARPASRVEVVVEGEGGARLRRAVVVLERLPAEDGGRADLPQRVRLVRDGGRFVRDPVGRATWRLRVTHPGKAPVTRTVALEERVERLHVTMKDT